MTFSELMCREQAAWEPEARATTQELDDTSGWPYLLLALLCPLAPPVNLHILCKR